jgi:putative transposase
MLNQLHSDSAREINKLDGAAGRQLWFQYWDTHLTYQRSYLARLNYVHHNPVHHALVEDAEVYPWCSAGWFGEKAPAGFARIVRSFRTDQISVRDPFEPLLPGPGSALVITKAVTGHRTP